MTVVHNNLAKFRLRQSDPQPAHGVPDELDLRIEEG